MSVCLYACQSVRQKRLSDCHQTWYESRVPYKLRPLQCHVQISRSRWVLVTVGVKTNQPIAIKFGSSLEGHLSGDLFKVIYTYQGHERFYWPWLGQDSMYWANVTLNILMLMSKSSNLGQGHCSSQGQQFFSWQLPGQGHKKLIKVEMEGQDHWLVLYQGYSRRTLHERIVPGEGSRSRPISCFWLTRFQPSNFRHNCTHRPSNF